jgi:hypothetical protein
MKMNQTAQHYTDQARIAELEAALEQVTKRLENVLRGKVSIVPREIANARAILAKKVQS